MEWRNLQPWQMGDPQAHDEAALRMSGMLGTHQSMHSCLSSGAQQLRRCACEVFCCSKAWCEASPQQHSLGGVAIGIKLQVQLQGIHLVVGQGIVHSSLGIDHMPHRDKVAQPICRVAIRAAVVISASGPNTLQPSCSLWPPGVRNGLPAPIERRGAICIKQMASLNKVRERGVSPKAQADLSKHS